MKGIFLLFVDQMQNAHMQQRSIRFNIEVVGDRDMLRGMPLTEHPEFKRLMRCAGMIQVTFDAAPWRRGTWA